MQISKTPVRTVEKVWGRELWLVNSEKYCAKRLVVNPGAGSSIHCHMKKEETFIIAAGSCVLLVEGTQTDVKQLKQGDSVTIPAGTFHGFWNNKQEECSILEISTHHDDQDVKRRTDSWALGVPHQGWKVT